MTKDYTVTTFEAPRAGGLECDCNVSFASYNLLGIKSLLLIDLFSYCNLDYVHDMPLKHVHRMSVSKELEG